MPHRPGQQRQRHEDRRHDVSTFITSFRRLLTFDQVRVEHAGDPILEDRRIVGDPHEVVVDVAEAERHVGADVDELAPGQPRDDVALRRDDAPQRRRPRASRRGSRRTSVRRRVVEHRLLELVEPVLELLDLRPVVIDHRVDDAVEQRDRPFADDLRVARDSDRCSSAIDREWPSWTVTR